MIEEYNDKGFFLIDSLDLLKDPLEQEIFETKYQMDYREDRITAKDIILPPFLD